MAQHFLLSAAARSLSLAKVMRLTDDQAFDLFRSIRWSETDGDAVCGKTVKFLFVMGLNQVS